MAMWLPNDFYDAALPSPFAIAVKELGIRCEEFKFMNVDKIIISYRIIKALGLDETEENCSCENCKLRAAGKSDLRSGKTKNSNKHMREQLYILQSKSNIRDGLFETGFEISLEEEMSELEDMMENKLKSYNSRPPQDSIIFYRLREKMEVLEDDIQMVKGRCNKEKPNGSQKSIPEESIFETPKKLRPLLGSDLSTYDRSRKSKKLMSPSTNLQMMKSLPNLELLPLEHEFSYNGYALFEKAIKLTGNQLQAFKHSLICFDEKIYLKKTANEAIYCLALAKGCKIKIRISFEGEEEGMNDYSVDMDNPTLTCDFNEEKYEFTLKLTHYL